MKALAAAVFLVSMTAFSSSVESVRTNPAAIAATSAGRLLVGNHHQWHSSRHDRCVSRTRRMRVRASHPTERDTIDFLADALAGQQKIEGA